MRSLAGDDSYWATPEHFLFALYSKLVQPGARRIASDYGDASRVTDVAFANPDGTIAVIVANQTDRAQDFGCENHRRAQCELGLPEQARHQHARRELGGDA